MASAHRPLANEESISLELSVLKEAKGAIYSFRSKLNKAPSPSWGGGQLLEIAEPCASWGQTHTDWWRRTCACPNAPNTTQNGIEGKPDASDASSLSGCGGRGKRLKWKRQRSGSPRSRTTTPRNAHADCLVPLGGIAAFGERLHSYFAKHRSAHSHGGKRMRTNRFRNKTMWWDAAP